MKPVAFAYERPATLAEALRVLADSPEGKVIAGGQSLIPMMNFRLSRPEKLIDINQVKELSFIEQDAGCLRIGALVRHQELHEHPLVREAVPVLAEAAGEVGHWAIRTRGTLGGSLTHADPSSELPAAMVALHATLKLQSLEEERQVPAEEFFLGLLTTDIQPHELLTSVEIPLAADTRFGFAEFARRPGDFALAGAYVSVRPSGDGEVTWFGVSSGPERRVLTFAEDEKARRAQFAELAEELEPLSEPAYRRSLAVEVAEQAYQKAIGGRN
ncbi:FAD binding domain-containing protein [Alicyclobacillus cycloheptanicus]|uniref:Carbon-monoxide dehydrogenase medium subunit n=1 Tax=Alicyclobacillus cycloheptanicus TaxID=1457 RepID=A0ABT9XIU5_9BACL|nr:FAD binding domain-containing protein [Alicyclobacillus cycloheptanicus]MDQ0190225.1 carbon-monoxide dehydrogenase medium subunit [Alicyclobacillus cycloheptanicus]